MVVLDDAAPTQSDLDDVRTALILTPPLPHHDGHPSLMALSPYQHTSVTSYSSSYIYQLTSIVYTRYRLYLCDDFAFGNLGLPFPPAAVAITTPSSSFATLPILTPGPSLQDRLPSSNINVRHLELLRHFMRMTILASKALSLQSKNGHLQAVGSGGYVAGRFLRLSLDRRTLLGKDVSQQRPLPESSRALHRFREH